MSVIPAQGAGHASNAGQSAWDLGQLARSLYDQWKNDETDRFALQLAAEKQAKREATMLPPIAQAVGKSSTRGGRGGSGKNRKGLPEYSKLRVPRSIANRITWDKFIVQGTFNASGTLAVLRQDFISQSNDPNAVSYQALFDSFCIVEATWVYTSLEAPGQSGSLPVTFLVREFNLFGGTTTAALQGYQSCQEKALAPGKSNTMTVAPEWGGTASSITAGANMRGWLNTATAYNVPHYGTVFGVNAVSAAIPMMWKAIVSIAYANGD